MIKIVVRMRVRPENEEEFRSVAKTVAERSSADDGNVYYTVNSKRDEPGFYALLECWKDQDSLDRHNRQEHAKKYLPVLWGLCDGEPEADFYNEI